MDKRVSRFERKTGFETFTDMVVETMQSVKETGYTGEKSYITSKEFAASIEASRLARKRNQSFDYEAWACAVAIAHNRYGG